METPAKQDALALPRVGHGDEVCALPAMCMSVERDRFVGHARGNGIRKSLCGLERAQSPR
jgi:hypothetical protein